MNIHRSIGILTLLGLILLFMVATFFLFALGVLIPGFFDELILIGLLIFVYKTLSQWFNRPEGAPIKQKLKESLYKGFLTYQIEGYIGQIDKEKETFSFYCQDGIYVLSFNELDSQDLEKLFESLANSIYPRLRLHLHSISKKICFYKLLLN